MLRTIQLYEQLSYFEASEDLASEIKALEDYLLDAKSKMTGQIDALVKQLYAQITSNKLPNKDGFFGGIHKWWKNLWGRDKESNPYYWQNRIGALGRTDVDPPTVEEYRMLKHLATSLEEAVEAQPLLITKILNGWSAKLHNIIGSYFDDMLARVRKMSGGPVTPSSDVPGKKLPVKKPKDEPMMRPEMPEEIPDEVRADTGGKESAEMRRDDVKSAKLPPSTVPSKVPPKVSPKSELDELAADFEIGPETKTTFGIWKGLTNPEKQIILTACDAKTPKCPKYAPTEEGELLLSKTNTMDIHRILRKHDGKSVENIYTGKESVDDPREKAILLAVHEPWLRLNNTERMLHNSRGNGGKPIKSRHRTIDGVMFPFSLPPVLMRDDPRLAILHDYYPELFHKLNRIGRVETEDDTPETLADRFSRKLRKGKDDGEFVKPDGSDEADEVVEPELPKAKPPLRDKAKRGKRKIRDDKVSGKTVTPEPESIESAPFRGEAESEKDKKKEVEDSRMGAKPSDRLEDESIASRIKHFPPEVSKPIHSLLGKDDELAKDTADAWDVIRGMQDGKDKKDIKARFKEMLKNGDFKGAISHTTNDHDDDVMKASENFKPKKPNLLEALKTRLRLQREGKATQWKPLPEKVEVKNLIERLRQQSKAIYQDA